MRSSTLDEFDLGPETCVIYLRISQDRTGTADGVERQEQDCRALAKRLGMEVVGVYRDNDISATSGKVRPEFEAMLKAKPEAIVAWHQDRLLRLTSDLEKVIALGIDVHFHTSSRGGLDLSTPAGRAVARTVAAWSQYEGEQKVLRQKRANLQRAERGHWHFSRRPYGYERVNGEIVIVPAEAEIVREGYRRYIAGETYYAIAADWNERGIPTIGTGSLARDQTGWSMTRVRGLLRNARYAGIVEYRGERVSLADGQKPQWEPLIDERTWSDYIETREGRARPHGWSNSTKHLMSGLAICGVCGGRMLARPEYRKNADGERVTQMTYQCTDRWCTFAPAYDIEPVVEGVVLARLADKRIVQALRHVPDTAPIQKEIASLRKRRDDIGDMLADGLLDKRRARQQLTTLVAQIDAARAKLAAMRKESPLTDLALARSIPTRWNRLSVLDKRRVIEELGLVATVNKGRPGRRRRDENGRPMADPRRVTITWRDEEGSS